MLTVMTMQTHDVDSDVNGHVDVDLDVAVHVGVIGSLISSTG